MALGVLGTPANIASGGSYTLENSTNRLVVFVALAKAVPAVTLTNISYNSITRTPSVQQNDSAGGSRDTVGICIYKESELPAGAASVTPTWSAGTSAQRIVCFTVEDADQGTTVRTSNGAFGNSLTPSVALSGLTVGDLCIGGMSQRSSSAGVTTNNSWTEDYDATNGDGGQFHAAHKVAASTSETYSLLTLAADDWAQAALAIIAISAGDTLMGQACL